MNGRRGEPRPLVFIFHGHGGSMYTSHAAYLPDELWPEAVVVWPQGLNTPGGLTDPKGERAGWQIKGGVLGDRDLKFFDAMLADLREEYRIDDSRVYAGGFSNGGAFTFLLWAVRADTCESSVGVPTESFFYPAGHVLSPEAPKRMVDFFQRVARPQRDNRRSCAFAR